MHKYYHFHNTWNALSTSYGQFFPHNVERSLNSCGKTNVLAPKG